MNKNIVYKKIWLNHKYHQNIMEEIISSIITTQRSDVYSYSITYREGSSIVNVALFYKGVLDVNFYFDMNNRNTLKYKKSECGTSLEALENKEIKTSILQKLNKIFKNININN